MMRASTRVRQRSNARRWDGLRGLAEIVIIVSLPPSAGPADHGGVTSRRIVFAVFPGFQILDLTGPHEVFTQAARLVDGPGAPAGRGRGRAAAGTGRAAFVIDTVAAAPAPSRPAAASRCPRP